MEMKPPKIENESWEEVNYYGLVGHKTKMEKFDYEK